jgi:ankyrin repeat protein
MKYELISNRFQWVTLEIEIFLGPDIMLMDTIDEKIEALRRKDLEPIDQLNIAYDQIYLSAIGKGDPNRKLVVETALQWMICAYEEFHKEDLALIASIKPDGTAFQPILATRLLRICNNFIVESYSGVLRLAHLTVRPYLERRQTSDNPFSSSMANLRAAMICLHFLNPDREDRSLHTLCEPAVTVSRKIRAYAYKHWTLHSRDSKNNDETPLELKSLINALYTFDLPSSPMHVAVRNGQVDAVQYGIATGANIEGKNLLGNTPLQEAVRWRSLPVLKLLLASGAAIDSQNTVGDTALHIASGIGLADFTEELLRHEADADISNYRGFAALHISVHHGHSQIVQLLLRFGAHIDYTDSRGNTALHYASMTSQEDVVAILVGAHCKKQLTNMDGETPLALAAYNKATEIEALLEIDRTKIWNQSIDHDKTCSSERQRLIRNQKIDFDTSGFCSRCDLPRWYRSALQGLSDSFYSSYQELVESANEGCTLCKVFVQEIKAFGLENEFLNTLASGITIQMILCSLTPVEANRQDLVIISLENGVRLELELSINRSTLSSNSLYQYC